MQVQQTKWIADNNPYEIVQRGSFKDYNSFHPNTFPTERSFTFCANASRDFRQTLFDIQGECFGQCETGLSTSVAQVNGQPRLLQSYASPQLSRALCMNLEDRARPT